VEYGNGATRFAERGLELEETTRIAGGDDVGVEGGDELGLAVAELGSGIWLDEIVNACGATADGSFGDL
jgi:hypothetical protein